VKIWIKSLKAIHIKIEKQLKGRNMYKYEWTNMKKELVVVCETHY